MEEENRYVEDVKPNSENPRLNKNTIIGILVFLLVLSFLGINLLVAGGDLLKSVYDFFAPLINQILYLFGFTAGTVINKTADIVTDTAKFGVDIAGGAVHDVGNLLIDTTKTTPLDSKINNAPIKLNDHQPDSSENPIQNPVSAAKTSWCLVGEYQGRRGCIEISERDKCISGQVFPEQKMCLNPTMTPNREVHIAPIPLGPQ